MNMAKQLAQRKDATETKGHGNRPGQNAKVYCSPGSGALLLTAHALRLQRVLA